MALGTVTRPTPNPDFTVSNRRFRTRDVQITSGANYTTGGESITPASVGLRVIQQVVTDGAKNAAGTSYLPVRYDYSANKIQAYRYDGSQAGKASLEEAASNFDASTFTARITFIGY